MAYNKKDYKLPIKQIDGRGNRWEGINLDVDGKAIKNARKNKKWPQPELAHQSGISIQTISAWENEKYPARANALSAIAKALGQPLENFIKKRGDVTQTKIFDNFGFQKRHDRSLSNAQLLLAESQNELTPVKAIELLDNALSLIDASWPGNTLHLPSATLASVVLMEKSRITNSFIEKYELREQAINRLINAIDQSQFKNNWMSLVTLSENLVTIYWDSLNGTERAFVKSQFIKLKNFINKIFKYSSSSVVRSILLSQLSSMHRCKMHANRCTYKEIEKNSHKVNVWRGHRQKAINCDKRSIKEAPNHSMGYISSALTYWSLARSTRSEEKYNLYIEKTKKYLCSACDIGSVWAWLILARLYRQTGRPLLAIEAFEKYSQREPKRRNVLRESYIVGESAIHLWRQNKIESKNYVEESCLLLFEAYDAGYRSSRTLFSLASLTAALRGREAGDLVLAKVSNQPSGEISGIISKAIKHIENEDFETFKNAYVIGLDSGDSWNTMGSYFYDFYPEELDRAIVCYKAGRVLDRRSPVLLTNLSRTLLDRQGAGDVAEATHLVNQAYVSCDLGFRKWASEVKEKLKKIKSTY